MFVKHLFTYIYIYLYSVDRWPRVLSHAHQFFFFLMKIYLWSYNTHYGILESLLFLLSTLTREHSIHNACHTIFECLFHENLRLTKDEENGFTEFRHDYMYIIIILWTHIKWFYSTELNLCIQCVKWHIYQCVLSVLCVVCVNKNAPKRNVFYFEENKNTQTKKKEWISRSSWRNRIGSQMNVRYKNRVLQESCYSEEKRVISFRYINCIVKTIEINGFPQR